MTNTIGRDFILAGKAIFTMVGKDSRFTYMVEKAEPRPGFERFGDSYFVALLNGPDNTTDYVPMGKLNPATGTTTPTRISRVGVDAPSYKALNWALPLLFAGKTMPPSFGIYHEGLCGRCGRRLTVPESKVTGYGPECSDKLGLVRATGISPAPKAKAKRARKAPAAPLQTAEDQYEQGRQPSLTELAGQMPAFDLTTFLKSEL